MARPLTLVRPVESAVASGPSSAFADAVTLNDEVSTSSIKPASLGTAEAEARTGMLNRRNDVAVAAATAATGREVELEVGPTGPGKPGPPGGVGMGVVVVVLVAELSISVNDEFSRLGPAT
jgi:hypothetical protein